MASVTVMGGKKFGSCVERIWLKIERYALRIVLVLIASLLVGGVSCWSWVRIN